jgi:hypothetical protein
MSGNIAAFFQSLGDTIYEEWGHASFDERRFEGIATRALTATPPSASFTMEDVLDWVERAKMLRPQRDPPSKFGQPSLTIYDGGRFHIDILFWSDSTTSIHQHGFSGAFHVLAGSSLQVEYTFEQAERYSDRLSVGQLHLKNVEHLRAGDVRPIPAGDALIHALFHLERPSISVVVRTGADPAAGPQYTYLQCGIAFDPFHAPDVVEKQLQVLELLRVLGDGSLRRRARAMVQGADAFRAFKVVDAMASALPSAEYASFLGGLELPYAGLAQRLRAHHAERLRQTAIIERRRRIHQPDHRFFLALLLNVPSRRRILDMVASEFPKATAEETIERWVRELAELRHEDGRSALDIELDEAGLLVFGHLLRGAKDDEVVRALEEDFTDVIEQRDQIAVLCEAFRSSTLFRPLLRT